VPLPEPLKASARGVQAKASIAKQLSRSRARGKEPSTLEDRDIRSTPVGGVPASRRDAPTLMMCAAGEIELAGSVSDD